MKQKKNISIDPKIVRLGQELAKEDRRDFSSQVEVLIQEEYERRRVTKKAA